MKTILQRNIDLNIVTVVHYDIKPSVVYNKLGVKARPDNQLEEGIQFLEPRDGFDILFDHERGLTCFGIETIKLKEGIQKLKKTLDEVKLFVLLEEDFVNAKMHLLHAYAPTEENEFLISNGITVAQHITNG